MVWSQIRVGKCGRIITMKIVLRYFLGMIIGALLVCVTLVLAQKEDKEKFSANSAADELSVADQKINEDEEDKTTVQPLEDEEFVIQKSPIPRFEETADLLPVDGYLENLYVKDSELILTVKPIVILTGTLGRQYAYAFNDCDIFNENTGWTCTYLGVATIASEENTEWRVRKDAMVTLGFPDLETQTAYKLPAVDFVKYFDEIQDEEKNIEASIHYPYVIWIDKETEEVVRLEQQYRP